MHALCELFQMRHLYKNQPRLIILLQTPLPQSFHLGETLNFQAIGLALAVKI